MELPKYRKRRVFKNKVCQEPGCGKEFLGHPISKYCELHHDIRMRKRKRRVYEAVNIKNQIFEHNFSNVTEIEFPCQLLGCPSKFMINIFPKQFVYPKYCIEHRNEFKREAFLRNNNK